MSVVNQLGGPDVAWRSAFVLLGCRPQQSYKVYTNWGTAQLCPRAWLRAGAGSNGMVVRDAVRLRLDLMYIGERELHVNPMKTLATNDENADPEGPRGAARAIASGLARRAAEAERDAKRQKSANPMPEAAEPPAPVSYKLQTEAGEEMVVDFEFA